MIEPAESSSAKTNCTPVKIITIVIPCWRNPLISVEVLFVWFFFDLILIDAAADFLQFFLSDSSSSNSLSIVMPCRLSLIRLFLLLSTPPRISGDLPAILLKTILFKPINSENPTSTAVKSKTTLKTLITKLFLNAVIDCIEPANLVMFSPWTSIKGRPNNLSNISVAILDSSKSPI